MNKILRDSDLNLNIIIDFIESEQIFLYEDWKKTLHSFILSLNSFDFSLIRNSLYKNDILKDFVDEMFPLPESMWANLVIKNSLISVELIDPPYKFVSVNTDDGGDAYSSELEISQKIQVYKSKAIFGQYSLITNQEQKYSVLKIDRTVAACLVAFSLQFPSSLTALSQTRNISEESDLMNSLLKENYESLQNSQNKKFTPLLKTMYKINELSSKNYYLEDEKIDLAEKEEMIEHVAEMINSFYKHLNQTKKDAKKIAKKILEVSKDKDIDYRIMLSIIREESNFKQSAYNPSGDYSLAQINYNIWKDDYKKIARKPLHLKKLKEDLNYSLEAMGNILAHLKKNYGKDPIWYARYHSKTPSKKLNYAQKLHNHLKHLDKQESDELLESIAEFNIQLSRVEREDLVNSGIDEQKISMLQNQLSSMLVNFNNTQIAYNDD